MGKELTLDTVIIRKSNILSSDIDGEKVMMSIENSEYYGLGNSGSYIWDILEQEIQISSIVDQLLERFDVQQEQCISDVLPFLNHLLEKDLIEIVTN